MNPRNEELHDLSAQGQPPAYTLNATPHPQIMRPTNQKMKEGQPTLIPIGQPILDSLGQPVQIQRGTILEPRVGEVSPALIPALVGKQMGPAPQNTTCVSCREKIVTRVEPKANAKTNMIAIMLGMVCLWPCVLLTYSLDCCRNTDHYCPNCSAYIGSYVR